MRVEFGVCGGGVPGMGEVGRHPPGNIIAEGLDHAHVDVGVWIEEIPFVVVEVDAFDVNALGGWTTLLAGGCRRGRAWFLCRVFR